MLDEIDVGPAFKAPDAGTLQVAGSGFTSTTRNIVLGTDGGGFDIATAADVFVLTGSVTGPGHLSKTGAGWSSLNGVNSYSGGTTVSEGGLAVQATGALGTGSVTVDAAGAGSASMILGTSASAGTSSIRIANANSYLTFADGSSAGDATIDNSGVVSFNDDSDAGNARIANGGRLYFGSNATAGHAVITNAGSATHFSDNSTAGHATLINNAGSFLRFFDTSTAGSATINNNASLDFYDTSTAGNARLITAAAGSTSFTGTGPLGDGRVSAGSIEGAGSYSLRSSELTVGSNGLSTEVSGVISGAGGSLIKTGAGTLTLSGANTYSGATLVNAGSLIVNGSIASSTVSVGSGATLGGSGTIAGVVSIASGGELGVQVDSDTTLGGIPVTGYVRAAWAHYFRRDADLTAGLAGLPGAVFTVTGARPDRDSALVNVGATARLSERMTLGLNFDGEFSANSNRLGGSAQIRVSF